MDTMVERACGLDIGEKTVVASVMVGAAGQKVHKEVRTYRTFTADLEQMRDWLRSQGVTHVAMESTGPYWVPVYAVLEKAGCFEQVVGNAQHMRNVPGRKTDMKDADWIAVLLRHGLIRKSFVPSKPFRDLRDLLRYRRGLVQAGSTERNRLLKVLEMGNIKLACVATDVFGASGRLMLRALLKGHSTPEEMAQLAKGRLRQKVESLEQALRGALDEHHRCMLETQLQRIERTEADVKALDDEIDRRLQPYRTQHALLMQIPGVDWLVGAVIIAELGVDMTVFPTVRHAAAWAGVCPGNNQSGGKSKSTVVRKGNVYLKTALVQAAMGAARTGGSYYKNKYFRLRARRGAKRAAMAIAHKILIAAYHVLATGTPYKELGELYLDRRNRRALASSLVHRLKRLGYMVQIGQAAPA